MILILISGLKEDYQLFPAQSINIISAFEISKLLIQVKTTSIVCALIKLD